MVFQTLVPPPRKHHYPHICRQVCYRIVIIVIIIIIIITTIAKYQEAMIQSTTSSHVYETEDSDLAWNFSVHEMSSSAPESS